MAVRESETRSIRARHGVSPLAIVGLVDTVVLL